MVDLRELHLFTHTGRLNCMRVMLDLSHEVLSRSLCCVIQFAVARRPFVETRVSSSGETWQAKLIETNSKCGSGVGSCCSSYLHADAHH